MEHTLVDLLSVYKSSDTRKSFKFLISPKFKKNKSIGIFMKHDMLTAKLLSTRAQIYVANRTMLIARPAYNLCKTQRVHS